LEEEVGVPSSAIVVIVGDAICVDTAADISGWLVCNPFIEAFLWRGGVINATVIDWFVSSAVVSSFFSSCDQGVDVCQEGCCLVGEGFSLILLVVGV